MVRRTPGDGTQERWTWGGHTTGNRNERNAFKANAIREGLHLSDGSRMTVLDAYVVTPHRVAVATGWRTALLVKVARWRMWAAVALVGLPAGWFEFSWWQFAILAGGFVTTVKLCACVLASRWYRQGILLAPDLAERDDARVERWSHDDRYLASRWLGQDGWLEVMPVDYHLTFVDWPKRVETFVAWALAQFTIAGLVWGTVMWLIRTATSWVMG